MIEIATNLLGAIVEVSEHPEWNSQRTTLSLRARGVVRAVFMESKLGLSLLIEHELYAGLSSRNEISGGLGQYAVSDHVVREVKQCPQCMTWKHPSDMQVMSNPHDGPVWISVCKKHGSP